MDSIADMLAGIKNALKVRMETVDIPHSRMKEGLVKILLSEGYIGKYDVLSRMNKKYLRLALKYSQDKRSIITDLKRVSRPGRKIYVNKEKVPRVQAGFGTAVLSTSKGLMTDGEARKNKIGGEMLFYVW